MSRFDRFRLNRLSEPLQMKGFNMFYSTKAWTVVGYTFNADNYCVSCIRTMFGTADQLADSTTDTESILDRTARQLGINRAEESSFDSSDFPKVIFASQIDGSDPCGRCGEQL